MIATIDFETTGLKAGEDEVLQVSIIDENYNVLLNVYCRPNNKGSWEDAQAVHGITPLMVANCATYYGYEFKAHDSLEDVKATLYCYKKMEEDIERGNADRRKRVQNRTAY